ncbi:MAG: DegV family protein [Oscillospiraceae bacterium]|nr:DegV family protein [Oscillospiraceae bacterium]
MIRFMVDSASDCIAGSYDLFVPIAINLDGKEYLDGVDLDSDKFYELLLSSKDFPKTSQPAPQVFLEYFQQIKKAGDELIYFAVSSALSGTYQCAVMAKEMAEYDKIYVVDTLGATHMIGILVEHAAKLREKGFSAQQIVEEIELLKGRVHVLAGLDTLEYLRRGGRLSNGSAAVGSLAQIKPVLTVTREGTVEAQGKYIGKNRAMQQISERLQTAELDPAFPVVPVFSCCEENCELLENRLKDAGVTLASRRQIGSTIGAHTGPGVYGVIFVTK